MAKKHKLKVGDNVRWNDPGINDFDPEDRQIQKERVYTILRIDE